ncbi:MAG: hypothetical protein MR821_06410, partial [Clostridiales bacterium]|nr:hypothetical protein [Clostridiales bacterium]
LWDRSLPPPVADAGRRSVGNRKERARLATMRVPRTETARAETAGEWDIAGFQKEMALSQNG